MEFIRKCDKFHRNTNFHHALAKLLCFVTMLWPFYQWGMEILCIFSLALYNLKKYIVGVEYFMKWIEVECLQDHNRKDFLFLMTQDYVQVRSIRRHHLRQ